MNRSVKYSINTGIAAAIFSAPAAQAGELFENGGSWLQIVAEGSLGAVNPDWQIGLRSKPRLCRYRLGIQ